MMRCVTVSIVALLLALPMPAVGRETITRGQNLSADIASDGRIAMDLRGDIWVVPGNGGKARRLTRGRNTSSRPRWSPDASRIVYQVSAHGMTRLNVLHIESGSLQSVSRDGGSDLQPSWHPHGDRIVYASDRSGRGLDLWEVHLPTGLHWRLSDRVGDEREPAWSADGRDLVYIHRDAGRWSLILRRHGEPEETLLVTSDRLSAPSWRPDGSLITFLRGDADTASIEMVILSDPRLLRTYGNGEKFVSSPISWRDRQRMVYTADGTIRRRSFDDWSSQLLPFEAEIRDTPAAPAAIPRRQLPVIDTPPGRLVLHAFRMFDGVAGDYRYDVDIVIDDGRIAAVEAHTEGTAEVVIDLGDLTVLPGFIDAAAALPSQPDDKSGALLLATGVTTLVARTADAERLNAAWSGKLTPGPRVLDANAWPVTTATAVADAMTPGLAGLLESRQARAFGEAQTPARRFREPPVGDSDATSLVLGSRDNGLRPGLALHAEFLTRVAAGLEPAQVLRAAGVNPAAALGVDPFLGRIAVGAFADLLFVDGDPLADIGDAIKIVAVIRNGRFFSLAGLLERAADAENVE